MAETSRFETWRIETHEPYSADPNRYDGIDYRRTGRSGLHLPPLSLGFWYNFGDNRPFDIQREIVRASFDRGISHFDLANNYGPPPGSAEENFGRLMRRDFARYRNELVISTKAGWGMWPGPYGEWGGRKYLMNSLDESLERMSLDYVDIFYSHRPDPNTPLEETIGALDAIVRSGKALYVGISSYDAEYTRQASAIAKELGTPILIHQPSYSLLNRWVEPELLQAVEDEGIGVIPFSVLAQGLLSDRYLAGQGVERATKRPFFNEERAGSAPMLERLTGLAAIAKDRGQSLAQMALAWVLNVPQITSALIGVSSVAQVEENLAALQNLEFSADELAEIDRYAAAPGQTL